MDVQINHFKRQDNILSNQIISQNMLHHNEPLPDSFQHPDLFQHNADIIINKLFSAFCEHNFEAAKQLIKRYSDEHSSHSQLRGFQTLLAAQLKTKMPVKDIQQEFNELRDTVAPLALKLLGLKAQDFLSPFWQRLALNLKGQHFNPLAPDLHDSFICGEINDWIGVREAVENELDWHQHPILIIRLTNALYWIDEWESAMEIWCHLFWRFPMAATSAISHSENPNTALRDRWRLFDDNMEEELNPVLFPVWMLLTDSKMMHYSFPKNLSALTIQGKNYQIIRQFLLKRNKAINFKDSVELDFRMALKNADENLLKWYLRNRIKS
jgi:hypothetical protein